MDEPIAASRLLAVDGAVVARVLVAIVALFATFHDAIAAHGFFARGQAIIFVRLVAVVAFFLFGVDEAVTAASDGAGGRAIVGVVVVAVVAFLLLRVEKAVAAGRFEAGRRAVVGIVVVAIVALLARLDLAIAARALTQRPSMHVPLQWVTVVYVRS
ncbi:MAG: hypothetical protein DIU78_015535 [Pseudomonadota bacterium]